MSGKYQQKSMRTASAKRRRRRRRKNILLKTTIALLLALVIAGVGAAIFYESRDALAGVWQIDEVTGYRFNGRGAGALQIQGEEYPFAYRLTEGMLSVDFQSDGIRDAVYRCQIAGDMLILERGSGEEQIRYELRKIERTDLQVDPKHGGF